MSVANIGNVPDSRDLTDRELLIYLISRVDKLHDELEAFRPLLNMIKGSNGQPDMVGLMQARRAAKRAARGG